MVRESPEGALTAGVSERTKLRRRLKAKKIETSLSPNNMLTNILTPSNPRWIEFADRLAGPEGCNFDFDDEFNPVTRCSGTTKFSSTILRRMRGFNVIFSLRFYSFFGGNCDCEIMLNVEDQFQQLEVDIHYREMVSSRFCPWCGSTLDGSTILYDHSSCNCGDPVRFECMSAMCGGCGHIFPLTRIEIPEYCVLDSEIIE